MSCPMTNFNPMSIMYPQNQYPQYNYYQNIRQTIFSSGPCGECGVILHIHPPGKNRFEDNNKPAWYYRSGILQINGNGLSIVASGLGNYQNNISPIPACVAGGMAGCPNTFTATFLITSAAFNQTKKSLDNADDDDEGKPPRSGNFDEGKINATRVQYCGVIKFTICGTNICGQLVNNTVTRYTEPHTMDPLTLYNDQISATVNIQGTVNYCSGIRSISFSSVKIDIKNN